MKTNDRVGIVCTSSGILLFYVNGRLKGKLLKEKAPKLRYALVDLYGCCEQVKLLPLEKAPSERELPVKGLYNMCIYYMIHCNKVNIVHVRLCEQFCAKFMKTPQKCIRC